MYKNFLSIYLILPLTTHIVACALILFVLFFLLLIFITRRIFTFVVDAPLQILIYAVVIKKLEESYTLKVVTLAYLKSI
jgi:hypothetical protein